MPFTKNLEYFNAYRVINLNRYEKNSAIMEILKAQFMERLQLLEKLLQLLHPQFKKDTSKQDN